MVMCAAGNAWLRGAVELKAQQAAFSSAGPGSGWQYVASTVPLRRAPMAGEACCKHAPSSA